jgi:hypothetical protein
MGAMRTDPEAWVSGPSCLKVGERPKLAANPPTGFGPAREDRFVERAPAWGAFGW